jgi:hypothetical protein
MDDLIASVCQGQTRGYCITCDLIDAFMYCLAVPMLGAGGHVTTTLCFEVPVNTPDHWCTELKNTSVRRGLVARVAYSAVGRRSNRLRSAAPPTGRESPQNGRRRPLALSMIST